MNERKHRSSWGRFGVSADWLLIAVPGLIWGASFLFIAEGLKAIGPNGVAFVRLFIGFAALASFPAARKRVEWSAWPGIALVGVLWFAFPLSMFPFAEQRVSSALTGMLNAVVPLFTAIVATAIAGRVPERRVNVGLAIGFAGSVNILNLCFSRGFVHYCWHLIPTVDFFNITNAQTVIGEVSTFGSCYLYPFRTINPFVTRFGLRLTF